MNGILMHVDAIDILYLACLVYRWVYLPFAFTFSLKVTIVLIRSVDLLCTVIFFKGEAVQNVV